MIFCHLNIVKQTKAIPPKININFILRISRIKRSRFVLYGFLRVALLIVLIILDKDSDVNYTFDISLF
jgi:hypothetical protein